MSVRIRYRTDSRVNAVFRAFNLGGPLAPPPEPGDAWVVYWASSVALAGYAICCPKCKRMHDWFTKTDCGVGVVDGRCVHEREGGGSCWTWSWDPVTGTLSASPELDASVIPWSGCDWRGSLRDGLLLSAGEALRE